MIRQLDLDESCDLVGMFRETLVKQLGPNGLYPQHVIWRRGLTLRHETSHAPNKEFLSMVTDLIVAQSGIDELVFGLDVKNDGELQLEFDWAIALAYLKEFNWRFGVIPYCFDQRIVRSVNWAHPVVTRRLTAMVRQGLECHAKLRQMRKSTLAPHWLN